VSACFFQSTPAPTLPTLPVARATTAPSGGTPAAGRTPAPTAIPDPDRLLIRVDKVEAVSPDYMPPDLVALKATTIPGTRNTIQVRAIVVPPLEWLFKNTQAAGVSFFALSGYRSYDEQKQLLEAQIRADGREQALRQVAEPGHSEHQLGTAIDFTSIGVKYDTGVTFGQLPEGKWLAENAYKYGFVLSYPDGKESVTGHIYEPWHFRYVGPEVARIVRERGITLHEFLANAQVDGGWSCYSCRSPAVPPTPAPAPPARPPAAGSSPGEPSPPFDHAGPQPVRPRSSRPDR
jgi:D-alanyl-D-alanine carboxypeptidase